MEFLHLRVLEPKFSQVSFCPSAFQQLINPATPSTPALHSPCITQEAPGPYKWKVLPQISLQMGLSRLCTARKGKCSFLHPSQSIKPSSTINSSIYPLLVSLWKKKFTGRPGWVQIKNFPSISYFCLKLQNSITWFFSSADFTCHKAASVCAPNFCLALAWSTPYLPVFIYKYKGKAPVQL